MRKILRIDLSTRTYRMEEPDLFFADLGGRGLGAAMVSREIPPLADPLGAENKLILAPGILAGTAIPCSGRLSICAKSPLTGTIKEANAGGAAAQKLARLGLMAVVLERGADELCLVKIDREGVAFLPAGEYRGVGNYRFVEELKGRFGPQCALVTAGPAGEAKLSAAAIAVTTPDFHLRMAARGGLGAVLGAKKVKALVIADEGVDLRETTDQEPFKASVRALAAGIADHPFTGAMKLLGTPLLVDPINSLGCLATRNYSLGRFEGAEKISGTRLAELIGKRPHGRTAHRCMDGCVIQCSNVLTDEQGELIVASLEFETLALVGANCMIDDLEIIGRINRACNDAGLDTMDVGCAIAVAMEEGVLAWGDGQAALALVEEVGRTERGAMIGNGCRHTGQRLGARRVPHVKGQSLAAYDPRGLKGTGVTYATSPMGADHTSGVVVPDPSLPWYDHLSATGQGPMSKGAQTYMAAVDTLGVCIFAFVPMAAPELQKHLAACAAAVLGKPLPDDYLLSLGNSVLAAERAFNEAAGFGRGDDRLPAFFAEEALPSLGTVFDVSAEELDAVHGAAVPA